MRSDRRGRLHPVSVPYRTGRRLVGLIGPAVIVLFGARSLADLRPGPVQIAGVVALAVAAVTAWELAYYRRFEYRLVDDTLEIDSGVLSRRTREIPRGRIQNLDIREGIVGRLLGVAEVRFETAGGSETEARLRYVSRAAADRLQSWVDRGESADEPATPTEPAPSDRPEREPLYAITGEELAVLSLTSLDLRSLGFVLAAAFGLVPGRFGSMPTPREPGGTPGVDDLPGVGTAVSAVELSVVAILGNAVLRTARYFRFQLWEEAGTLRYERGLLRRYSGSIPLERLHLLRLRDNPLTRLTGYAALDVETAGYGPESGTGSEVAVPIAPTGKARAVADAIEPHERPGMQTLPRRARRRYAVRYAILVGVFLVGLYAVTRVWRPLPVPWYWGAALLAVVPPAAHLTWRNRGYAVGERHLIVRKGFWRRATYVVPFHRVQTVAVTSNPFQRRLRLATLRIDTATGTPAAVDIDAETAARLRERVGEELQIARRRRRRRGEPVGFRWIGEPDPG